ncbi:MAG: MBL fold metallo-hydrolase, partial [Myxococcales bacterium]
MRVTILSSGSKGNATLFESGGTALLVDAGISVTSLAARAPGLAAVVITHAHGDHTGNFRQIHRRLKTQVYMSEATARAHEAPDHVARYSPREPFAVGTLTVSPLPLPHDAAQVALVVSDGQHRVAIVTDLGEVPPGLVGHLRGCDALLVESNHDIGMLLEGPYPASLKRRISSARGHLSNDQLGELLRAHHRDATSYGLPGASTVVLMHLSEQNNRPDIARAKRDLERGVLRGDQQVLGAPPEHVGGLGPGDVGPVVLLGQVHQHHGRGARQAVARGVAVVGPQQL